MGRRSIGLLLLFGITAAACTSRTFGPENTGADEAIPTSQVTGTNGADVSIESAETRAAGVSVAGATITGDQMASSADISVAGSSVSVVSNVSGSTSVSVTSSSSTSSGGSSVVNVSVTTDGGSINRTVRFDRAGRFVLRVTADGDGMPVIQIEEVGP